MNAFLILFLLFLSTPVFAQEAATAIDADKIQVVKPVTSTVSTKIICQRAVLLHAQADSLDAQCQQYQTLTADYVSKNPKPQPIVVGPPVDNN